MISKGTGDRLIFQRDRNRKDGMAGEPAYEVAALQQDTINVLRQVAVEIVEEDQQALRMKAGELCIRCVEQIVCQLDQFVRVVADLASGRLDMLGSSLGSGRKLGEQLDDTQQSAAQLGLYFRADLRLYGFFILLDH